MKFARVLQLAVGLAIVVGFALLPLVEASGSGSFNYERTYFNNNKAEVYIERAPRLIYNPNAPADSYEPNGVDWYANMYSYGSPGCAATKCVPSVLNLRVYLKMDGYCGRGCTPATYWWYLNRFWPVSSTEYGTTITWSFTITGGNENLKGGISATVTGTTLNSVFTDYNKKKQNDGWTYLGGISIDIAESAGWNQVFIQGGYRLVIKNGDGPNAKDKKMFMKTEWDVSWRGCGLVFCLGPEYWYYASMIHGDNSGLGDGYIYVRTGDSNGS